MSDQPVDQTTNSDRPDARATVTAMTAGTLTAVAIFAVSFGLRLLGAVDAADMLGAGGVLVLLVTPALALVTTAVEMRTVQPASAGLAVVVLVVLGIATAVALLVPR